MHVCYVTRNYDAPHRGGRNPSLRYIERELRRLGHRVTIISTPSGPKIRSYDNVIFTRFSGSYYSNLLSADLRLYKALEKTNKNHKIDIVHACEREFAGVSAHYFCKKHVIPHIQWTYDRGYETLKEYVLQTQKTMFRYPVLWYLKWAENMVLSKCDVITTIGRDLDMLMKERGFEHTHFIGNTVDTDKFRPKKTDLARRLGLTGKIVSIIGRINPQRGTDIFVNTASIVKNATFVSVGADNEGFKKDYQKLAEKLGVKIHWLAQTDDVTEFLNMSDIIVIPVRKIAGGIGNALLEAMACGKPVVQSRVAGAPWVIENWKNGILFEDGDYNEAAVAITRILNDTKLVSDLGKNARKTVLDNYSVEIITKRLLEVYST